MNIPLVDLKAQYLSIKDEIQAAIDGIITKTAFCLGEGVEGFEDEFSKYCGCRYAIGTSSGTSALHLALLACGIGKGDEVITVPNTFIATAEAISHTGATPVFVDIDANTYNMDVSRIEAAITERTKAIIPVHLYGQTADMTPILGMASRGNLTVIEDACQAHGAQYCMESGRKWVKAGTMGHIGCFSFYPAKNLGAYGEAGAVVTNDDRLYETIRMLRDHGQSKRYHHSMVGFNYRMDGIQGAILRAKLNHLDEWNRNRRENAQAYNELLKEANVVTPFEADFAMHVYHLYVIRVDNRDVLRGYLSEKGISTGLHYPVPIHLQETYRCLGYKQRSFPITESYAGQILSLPIYPELMENEIEYITHYVKKIRPVLSLA